MQNYFSDEELEEALAAIPHTPQGTYPHLLLEETLGLEAYRRTMQCPTEEELGAYSEESLPLERALQIAAHEHHCPVCAEDIADLRRFLRQQVNQVLASTPFWTTPFVGREAIRETLTSTFASGNNRCLTLTAPAGTGKTRLALEAAVEEASLFADGVWYAPVSNVSTPAGATSALAHALQLPLQPQSSPLDQIKDFLQGKNALLVLDDLQADSPLLPILNDLASTAPDLHLLATTFQSIGLTGERTLPLPPLETPAQEPDFESLLRWESLQLFMAHVRTFLPDYRLNEKEGRATARICSRVAGIPLGIEIAAARMAAMSPREMLRSMEQRTPQVPPSHAALQEVMDWSVALLSQKEQALLQKLGVFTRGFFVDQAIAICETSEAPNLIESLCQKALLQRQDALGRARYQFPGSMRSFLHQQNPQPVQARKRFVAYFLQYAQERAACLEGSQQIQAIQELSTDLPNLFSGMDWAQESEDWQTTGQYGMALNRVLLLEGDWEECQERLRSSLDAFQKVADTNALEQTRLVLSRSLRIAGKYAEAEQLLLKMQQEAMGRDNPATQMEIKQSLGNLALFQGRYTEAVTYFEESLPYFEAVGNLQAVADCRQNLGWLAWRRGDSATAEPLLLASLTLQRQFGDRYRLGNTLSCLGNVAFEQGQLEVAQQWYQEAFEVRQELGDARGIAGAIGNVGMVWQALGDYARAEYCYAEAARRFERIGSRRDWGEALSLQGKLALLQGQSEQARRYCEEGLHLLQAAGDTHRVAIAQGRLGQVLAKQGQTEEATRLYRESLAQLQTLDDRSSIALQLSYFGSLLWEQGKVEAAGLALNKAALLAQEGRSQELAEIGAECQRFDNTLEPEQARNLYLKATTMTREEVIAFLLHA